MSEPILKNLSRISIIWAEKPIKRLVGIRQEFFLAEFLREEPNRVSPKQTVCFDSSAKSRKKTIFYFSPEKKSKDTWKKKKRSRRRHDLLTLLVQLTSYSDVYTQRFSCSCSQINACDLVIFRFGKLILSSVPFRSCNTMKLRGCDDEHNKEIHTW